MSTSTTLGLRGLSPSIFGEEAMKKLVIKYSIVILVAVIAITFVDLDDGYHHAPIIFIVIIAVLAILLIKWKSAKKKKTVRPARKMKKSD